MTLSNLNKTITRCTKCERLVNFREKIQRKKKTIHRSNILGKPITGYGDQKAINGRSCTCCSRWQ